MLTQQRKFLIAVNHQGKTLGLMDSQVLIEALAGQFDPLALLTVRAIVLLLSDKLCRIAHNANIGLGLCSSRQHGG